MLQMTGEETQAAFLYALKAGPSGLGNDVLEGCDVLATRCLGHVLRDLGIGAGGVARQQTHPHTSAHLSAKLQSARWPPPVQ